MLEKSNPKASAGISMGKKCHGYDNICLKSTLSCSGVRIYRLFLLTNVGSFNDFELVKNTISVFNILSSLRMLRI